MAYLIGAPLLLALAILQSTLFGSLRLVDGAPDLVLLASVGWALAGRPYEAMGWGLLGGMFLDMFSGLPFGLSAIFLILISFLVSLVEGRFWEAHLLMPLGATLIASLLYHSLSIGLLLVLGRSMDIETAFARIVLPSTFLNLVLAYPASQVAGNLRDALFPPEIDI